MAAWQEYSEKFSALTPREKVIIGLSSVFLSAYLVFILVVEPQLKVLSTSQSSLNKEQGNLAALENQISDIKHALKTDPNERVKAEIKQLNQQLQKVNDELDKTLVDYVAPDQMAKELTSLLSTSNEVRVVGVTIQKAEKIKIDVKESDDAIPLPAYYRHGFEVVVSGNYFNLMKLVKKISSQNNKFSVNNLNYRVTAHPIAEMTLSLVTVSDSENVIRL